MPVNLSDDETDGESSGREPLQHGGGAAEPGTLATALIAGHRWFLVEDFLEPLASFGVASVGCEQRCEVEVGL